MLVLGECTAVSAVMLKHTDGVQALVQTHMCTLVHMHLFVCSHVCDYTRITTHNFYKPLS